MRTPASSRGWWAGLLAACTLVGGVACGSDTTTSSPATSATSATVPGTAGGLPPTTQFTFPPRPTAAFVGGEGTLTLTGDQQATAQFSSTSCAGITVTEVRGFLATLVFVSGGSKAYILDIAGLSPGRTTFPEPSGFNQVPPRRVRLTTESGGSVLQWGTTAAGTGTVTGTVSAAVGNARSGSFELDLGFAGDEGGPVPPFSQREVHASGSWTCP